MEKWQRMILNGDALQRYRARQFIQILRDTKLIKEFDTDLYFRMVGKIEILGDSINVKFFI